MTDAERAKLAKELLAKTTDSYPAWKRKGFPDTNWAKAFRELDAIIAGTPVPPPGQFGAKLPPRMPESTGPNEHVASEAEMISAIRGVSAGTKIVLTANLNGGNRTLNIDRRLGLTAEPITLTCLPGVTIKDYYALYTTARRLRFRGLDISSQQGDGIKPTAGYQDVEIDRCHFHDILGDGIIATDGSIPHRLQVWNSRFIRCGQNWVGYSHGIYWSYTGGPGSVLANCLFVDPGGYGMQMWTDCPDLIVTCSTFDGPKKSAYPGGVFNGISQGGLVMGGSGTTRTRTIGTIVSNAPFDGFHGLEEGPDNRVFDSIAFGNGTDPSMGGSNFGGGLTYENCVEVDPMYANRASLDYHLRAGSPAIGLIKPERYGYVPPTDIEGKVRRTADAGCYAA